MVGDNGTKYGWLMCMNSGRKKKGQKTGETIGKQRIRE